MDYQSAQKLIKESANTGSPMPEYQCHKKVWALKIKAILYDSDEATLSGRETDGSAILIFEMDRFAPIKVTHQFVRKRFPVNGPRVGGYYVVYKDGYQSFSPQEAFEDGYTLIS